MPAKLTEEQRLRRNARERAYYYAKREQRLAQIKAQQKESGIDYTERSRRYRARNPQKASAQRWVQHQVERKNWPPVGFFRCSDCDARAQNYHHEDYELRWSVEPLCTSCHGKRHRS